MRVALVVLAAGLGLRLGAGDPKALRLMGGQTILEHAVRGAVNSGVLDAVVVVVPAEHLTYVRDLVGPLTDADTLTVDVVAGGELRQDSVRAGLRAVPADIDTVLVHDAARCLAPPELFTRVLAAVQAGADAVVPAQPVTDTIKQVDGDVVVGTPDRAALVAVQTPQGFRRTALEAAHQALQRVDGSVTDDARAVELAGGQVRTVPGEVLAMKITTPLDLAVAEAMVNDTERSST